MQFKNKFKKLNLHTNTVKFESNHQINTLPVGSVTYRKGCYNCWCVKVDENTWKRKHIYIYEQVHGPISKDSCVIFLDGDRENFDIDNLYLLTRRELLYLIRGEMLFNNRELTLVAINLCKLQNKITDLNKKRGKK